MRARTDILLGAWALGGWCCGSAFAALPWPTPDALDAARKSRPLPALEQLQRTPVPALPRITSGVPGMDIDAIAQRHLQLKNGATATHSASPSLMIFVTLGMPTSSLQLLTAQAERAQATLMLRGLKAGSMKQTLEAVQALIGARKVAWRIDPEAFVRYQVHHAPTFVLMKHGTQTSHAGDCGTSCVASDAYYRVAGDVSLDYALDTLLRRHPAAQGAVAPFLTRLQGTP